MADVIYSGDSDVQDGATFAAATNITSVIGGVFNDSIASISSGSAGAARLTTSRALHVNPRDAAGAVLFPTASAIADSTATPTVTGVASFSMLWDTVDADWDRQRSISADGVTNDGLAAAGLVAWNGTTYDRAKTIQGLDAAPNTDVGVLAIGKGPGWDRKQNPAGVSATSTASAVTVVVDGADVVVFHVTTIGVTPGSMIFETTGDDSAWATAGAVMKLGSETWITGSFVPAVNDVYMVRTTGLRQVRYRVNAVYASGTATVKWTGASNAAILKSIDVGPAPHNFGYALTSKTAQYTTTQTGVALWTPASGKKVVILGYQIQAGGTVAGAVQVWFGASADTTYTRGTDLAIFDGEFAPSSTIKPGAIANGPFIASAVDHILRVTDSAAINPLTVTVWGYEV